MTENETHPKVRLFQWEDLEAVANILAHPLNGTLPLLSSNPRILLKELQQPLFYPTKNMLVAENGDIIQGFAIAVPEINIGRSIIYVCTTADALPVTTEILTEAVISRAMTQRAKVAHAIIADEASEFRALLKRKEFRYIRRLLNMRLSDSMKPMAQRKYTKFKIRRMKSPEEIPELTILQNVSFRSHFGYSPNTTEEIEYRLSLPGKYQDVIFAEGEDGVITAFCWFSITESEGIKKGRLDMLGVHTDRRKEGQGKAMLEAGIQALQQQKAESISLEVDEENLSAVHLYEQVGFYKVSTSVWLELKLQ